MTRKLILDTGPLVAMLNRREKQHLWVKEVLSHSEPPFLSCDAVISEACFLLRDVHDGQAAVMRTLSSGLVILTFKLNEEFEPVSKLVESYASVPVSLADACLVRMSELYSDHAVLTFDSDFRIYRKNRHQAIPVLMPDMES